MSQPVPGELLFCSSTCRHDGFKQRAKVSRNLKHVNNVNNVKKWFKFFKRFNKLNKKNKKIKKSKDKKTYKQSYFETLKKLNVDSSLLIMVFF